jgi:hypothetical protein
MTNRFGGLPCPRHPRLVRSLPTPPLRPGPVIPPGLLRSPDPHLGVVLPFSGVASWSPGRTAGRTTSATGEVGAAGSSTTGVRTGTRGRPGPAVITFDRTWGRTRANGSLAQQLARLKEGAGARRRPACRLVRRRPGLDPDKSPGVHRGRPCTAWRSWSAGGTRRRTASRIVHLLRAWGRGGRAGYDRVPGATTAPPQAGSGGTDLPSRSWPGGREPACTCRGCRSGRGHPVAGGAVEFDPVPVRRRYRASLTPWSAAPSSDTPASMSRRNASASVARDGYRMARW